MTKLSRNVSRHQFLFVVVWAPILWEMGAASLAWIGFTGFDILTAFFIGFCVGLVHDLYLVSVGAMAYGPRVVGIAYHNRFVDAMNLFEIGEWQQALDLLEEVLELDPLAKEPLYFAIMCAKKLEDWDKVSMYSEKYLKQDPDDQDIQDVLSMMQ